MNQEKLSNILINNNLIESQYYIRLFLETLTENKVYINFEISSLAIL